MTYRERPATRALAGRVACVWDSRQGSVAQVKSIVPDGCIDLIWSSHDEAVHVAGPDTRPFETGLRQGEQFAAVRFRPGAGAAVLGLPASALRDARVPLAEIWKRDARRFADLIAVAPDGSRVLEALIAARVLGAGPPDRTVAGVVRALAAGGSGRSLAADLGYSERHLRRLCQDAFGYGPKTLHRVLRFQRALRLIGAGRPLGEVAATCGFADQAHLTREVRALSGRPPSLLAARQAV
ncbi:MAG TPA: helix-turn-helix domain-containing protein [Jiangellaceae bacterium]